MKDMKIDVICNVYDTHPPNGEEMRHGAVSVLSTIELNQGRQSVCNVERKREIALMRVVLGKGDVRRSYRPNPMTLPR